MNTKDILREFMALAYSSGKPMEGLEDVVIGNYIIARITGHGLRVLWLLNGNKLKISWKMVDLFTSLNTINGEKVMWEGKHDTNEDKVGKIIYLLVLLINQFNWGKGKDFLETLACICETGTEEFREWFEKEFGEKLQPIELITAKENILI